MSTLIKIDFVSDVSCPWCVIGLYTLEQALSRLRDLVKAEFHCQPFELNPHMVPGGQDINEHLTQKYGTTTQQQAEVRERIRTRGAELGFVFRAEGRDRIFNTFNAHRLLHWAGLPENREAKQLKLKKALFEAYFTRGQSPDNPAVLVECVTTAGLDPNRARAILEADDYAEAVRADENQYTKAGIHSVPAIIFNERYLISGAQPIEIFEQALQRIISGEASGNGV